MEQCHDEVRDHRRRRHSDRPAVARVRRRSPRATRSSWRPSSPWSPSTGPPSTSWPTPATRPPGRSARPCASCRSSSPAPSSASRSPRCSPATWPSRRWPSCSSRCCGRSARPSDAIAHVLALVLATLISMLFGELVPKNAAIARPMPTARRTAGPMRVFSRIVRLADPALNGSANWLVRRLGVEPQEELASARSPEELGLLAAYSAQAGALPEETALLLRRTIRFGEKRAAEAMTPRVDVIGVPAGTAVEDVLELIRRDRQEPVPGVRGDARPGGRRGHGHRGARGGAGPSCARRRSGRSPREPVLVPESLDLDGVLATLQAAGAGHRHRGRRVRRHRRRGDASRTWSRSWSATSPTSTTSSRAGAWPR